jgi:hypothetical protein
MLKLTIDRVRHAAALAAAAVAIMAGAACSDSTGASGNLSDKTPPTIEVMPGASTDTVVSFFVEVKDNLGIKKISVNVSGALSMAYDTTFTTANTDAVVPFNVSVPASIPRGTPIVVTAFAFDGALNKSPVGTLTLTVGNVPAAEVSITSPATNTVAVIGKSVVLSFKARSAVKILSMGFRTLGSFATADSIVFSTPLPDSVVQLDTLTIPSNAITGNLQVIPFLIDSLGQRTVGPVTVLSIQPLSGINSIPIVSFSRAKRLEVRDTISVEASDQTGVTALGYEVRRVPGGAIDAIDSVTSNGTFTTQIKKLTTQLPYTMFPTTVYVQAFARNSNGVRAYAKLAGGADRIDTVVVVAGSTRSLPSGGSVADAVYHPRTDRLYLTNIERNELEVFSLTDSSFKSPILVGSRPWGVTFWPRDHTGAVGDTLIVANSGGTDFSYVNLNAAGSGREVSRYTLPNIIAFTVTSVRSETTQAIIQQRTKYDFSDRPQFVAATCTGSGSSCGDVVVTYSTTPTPGQSAPFNKRNGTLRWENLTKKTSHLFFEQAIGQEENRSDTLEVIRYDGLTGDATTLVPYQQLVPVSASKIDTVSVVVKLGDMGFRDTTFVRNSGDFRRAVFGESGAAEGSRALVYDATRGLSPTFIASTGSAVALPIPTTDRGVSPASDVTDFIANSFAKVEGVAMNFDGSLAGIRADSTYLLNPSLRLQGILPTTQSNAGLDFHPQNNGPNSFPLSSRLVFAASAEPEIEIFDSYCYKRVSTVPIRDPIIGPIKAAIRPSTGQIVLVGATARGVVIVTLPDTFTTSCL